MFNPAQRTQAENLAVRYAAYTKAVNDDDDNGIIVWGPMLLDTMTITGVYLMVPDSVERMVRVAKAIMKQTEAT